MSDAIGLSGSPPLIENQRRMPLDALLDTVASACSTLLCQVPSIGAGEACGLAEQLAGLAAAHPAPPCFRAPTPRNAAPPPAAAPLLAPLRPSQAEKNASNLEAAGPGAGRGWPLAAPENPPGTGAGGDAAGSGEGAP